MKNINEELQRMLYLTQHKRGVVISEQEVKGVPDRKNSEVDISTKAPDWNGGSSGQLDVTRFSKDATGILVNATNVGYKNDTYNLAISRSIGKDLPYTIVDIKEPVSNPPTTNSGYSYIGKTFPYPDNMVTPQITKNLDAEKLFLFMVDDVVKRINDGQKIKIKAQGFADSARPTKRAPAGYTKEQLFKDHKSVGCDRLYCGEKDDSRRNLWLADNRAKKMVKFLLSYAGGKLNKNISDIPVEYLEPVSSYVPGVKSKQRVGTRSVNIIIEAIGYGGSPGQTEPGKVEMITIVPQPVIGTIDFDGTIINVIKKVDNGDYVKIFAEKNEKVTSLLGNKIPNLSEPGKLNGKTSVGCSIINNEVTIDGVSWGNITEIRDNAGMYANIKYATSPNKICCVGDYDNQIELGNYSVILQFI